MNTKQELLQNPLVKEIAMQFASEQPNLYMDGAWEAFVKSNEPVREWEILEYLLEHNQLIGHYCAGKIKSVKRLSDGIVFSVGDITHAGEITSFEIQGQNMIAKGSDFEYHINQLEKDKLPLFKTHNGKDVWENQVVLMLDKHSWTTRPIAASEAMIRDCGFYKDKEKLNLEFFSNDVAAQEYITLNKPCLSVQDVNELLIKKHFMDEKAILQKVIELAKSKQNNN